MSVSVTLAHAHTQEKERLRKEYIEELKKRHEEDKARSEQLYVREQAGRRDDQVRQGQRMRARVCVREEEGQGEAKTPWIGGGGGERESHARVSGRERRGVAEGTCVRERVSAWVCGCAGESCYAGLS